MSRKMTGKIEDVPTQFYLGPFDSNHAVKCSISYKTLLLEQHILPTHNSLSTNSHTKSTTHQIHSPLKHIFPFHTKSPCPTVPATTVVSPPSTIEHNSKAKYNWRGNRTASNLQCNGMIADGSRCSEDGTIADRCTNRPVHMAYHDDWPDS